MHRHQLTIYRRATGLDTRGQVTGTDTIVMRDVPCEVKQLSGRQITSRQKHFADATYEVRFYPDPQQQIRVADYFLFGTRRLEVGALLDEDQTNFEVVALCREEIE